MKKLILLSVAALGLVATPAVAGEDGGAYVGAGAAWIEDAGIAIFARAGYSFNDYFGIEGDGAFGVSDKSQTVLGVNVDTGVTSSFAGYAVGRIPLGEQFDLIARVGYHSTKVEATSAGASASATASGVAYGGGAEFKLNEDSGIRADLTLFTDNGTLTTASIGYFRHF